MKASELMIGDWLRFTNARNGYSYEKVVKLNAYNNDIELGNHWVEVSNMIPIPLTPEILEKNGWTAVPDYGMPFEDGQQDIVDYHWSPNFNTYPLNLLQLADDSGMFKVYNGVTIYYVHELQHALRLCGLDELADNFRI